MGQFVIPSDGNNYTQNEPTKQPEDYVVVRLLVKNNGKGQCIGLDFYDTEYDRLSEIYTDWRKNNGILDANIGNIIESLYRIDNYREMVSEDFGPYGELKDFGSHGELANEIAKDLFEKNSKEGFYILKVKFTYHAWRDYFEGVDTETKYEYKILERKDHPDGKDFDDIDEAEEYWNMHNLGLTLSEYLGISSNDIER